MKTLEQRMLEAIRGKVLSKEETAKACAAIALEEIRKALKDKTDLDPYAIDIYLLENHIIEEK